MMRLGWLTRPMAGVMGLAAVFLAWPTITAMLRGAAQMDPGLPLFTLLLAALYSVAAVMLWRRSRTAAIPSGALAVLWLAMFLRGGHVLLPYAEVALAAIAVLAWLAAHRLVPRTASATPGSAWLRLALALLIAATAIMAPVWMTHWGFAGERHGHTILAHPHVH